MIERNVKIDTRDGAMRAFVVHPEGVGPFPAVVMYQNVGGLSEYLRDMARRVAQNGYYCVIPDLYYRLGTVVLDADTADQSWVGIRSAIAASIRDVAPRMNDTASLLEFIDQDAAARRGPKGVIGYCGGARYALIAAQQFSEVFHATVSLFPVWLIEYGYALSPHRAIESIRGGLYLGFAEHDEHLSQEEAEAFVAMLRQRCTASWQAEFHPGTRHGFAFPARKAYHREASELTWRQAFDLLRRHINP